MSFVVFLMVIFGLVELGRGAWAYSTLAHATRQGARFAVARGSINPTSSDSVASVVKNHAMGLEAGKIEVTTTWDPSPPTRGGAVEVRSRYQFELVTSPIVLPGTTITLGSKSRMIVAN